MKLFTKIFLFILISFIVVVSFISYFITIEQISDTKKNVLQEYKIIGSFLSKEIEVGYFESHWPFESLKKLSEYKGFLFWWIVDDKGVIHLANNASFIRTVAKDYFPEIALKRKQAITLNLDKNYAIFFKPLGSGKNKWSFWYGFSLDKISERKKDIILLITSISISALSVVGITLFFGIKHFMRPIKTLSNGASVIGGGNLTHRVEIESQDELSDLAQSFNKMAEDLQKSYTALQESEGKYRELAEFLPQPVFELDINSDFIYGNRCGLETFGYTLDDLEKGVNALQLFIPEERERVQQNIQKRIAGEDFEDHKYTGLRKDGSVFPILIYSAPIMRNGEAVGVRGIVVDISERKIAEDRIIRAKEEWESTFNTVPDLIAIIDDKYRMVRVNKAMAEKMGVSPDDAVGLTCYEHVHGTNEPPPFCPHKQLLSDGQEHKAEVHEDRLDGIFQVSVTPFHNIGGKLTGSVHVAHDITERKKAEQALIESEVKYRGIFNESVAAIYVFDTEKNFLDSNQSGLDLLGYSREELLNMSIPDVDANPTVVLPAHKQLLGGERIINYEHQLKRKDGKIVTVINNSRPLIDAQGNLVGMQSTLIDITERKHAEEQLKASLEEKEILLREIHHRVKNNLAVISSLLSMQTNIVTNQDVHSALQESQSRVQAMALIHETLYQSESLASVDLERYVKELIGNIANAFDSISNRINFKIEVRDVKLEINQAIPCGLIINELVTNALKHAFADGQNGVVRITAGYTKEREVELMVSDNGTGFSEELDWKKSKSLGLRLISLMVDQLHGIMNIRNNHGAEIAIKWPVQVA
jgi:PAS domain S-box-containing protein